MAGSVQQQDGSRGGLRKRCRRNGEHGGRQLMINSMRTGKRARLITSVGGAAVAVTIGLSMIVPAVSTNAGASSKKVTLSIAFGSTYVMATAALAPEYYGNIAK